VPVAGPGGGGPSSTQSDWWDGVWPITQDYGCTQFALEGYNPRHPQCQYWHSGIDFGLPCGNRIHAAADMYVLEIDPPGYGPPGNSAALHLRNVSSARWDIWLYHMSSYAVSAGDQVPAGTYLGDVGARGWATGCHVHFEVRPRGGVFGTDVDPTPFLFWNQPSPTPPGVTPGPLPAGVNGARVAWSRAGDFLANGVPATSSSLATAASRIRGGI
jgi:murein DD-endopeptidase MepM/ murein hydrolase activator NlpD